MKARKTRFLIIDSHSHIWDKDWMPEWWWEHYAHGICLYHGFTIEEARKKAYETWDPTGDYRIKVLDEAGIDKAMLLPQDMGLSDQGGDAEVSIEDQNRLVAEVVRRHPDRFFLGVGVDPRRPNAIEIVEKAVKEYGARVLKLHTGVGFYPNERYIYPLYGKCVELGIPVLFHTGRGRGLVRSRETEPIYLDDLAYDFPELTIIAGHTGYLRWDEMVDIARAKPNIVCDLGNWQSYLPLLRTERQLLRFYETIQFILYMLGPGRLMFGSDWVGYRDASSLTRWVKFFTEIPEFVREAGIEFTEEELADFFSVTATKVFHLETDN